MSAPPEWWGGREEIMSTTPKDGQAALAAKMAGDWWADRLLPRHADKREAFALAVAKRVEQALNGVYVWTWHGERKAGDGTPRPSVLTENDYDPHGLLLEAVREVVAPNCRGVMFSGDGILPQKHTLSVSRHKLTPKEGYGNYRPDIEVPHVHGAAS